jgi:hypothetical protein
MKINPIKPAGIQNCQRTPIAPEKLRVIKPREEIDFDSKIQIDDLYRPIHNTCVEIMAEQTRVRQT